MTGKDAFQERVSSHIAELYEAVERHENHLESTESVSHDAHVAALREAQAKRDHLKGLMKQVEDAGESAWEHLRDGVERAMADLKTYLDGMHRHLHE